MLGSNNPYAALSSRPATTQREEPKPKKDLALAKDASKVHTPKEEKPPKPVDPKTGTGNNSAKPGRPERPMDRKGRTYDKPKKSVPGTKDERTKRDGKDWGEGKMGKQVEDGVQEATAGGEAGAAGADKPRRERRERGERGERGRRGDREPKPELTEEEKAALEAERAAEARRMTLEEYNAKKAQADAAAAAEIKEARKVEQDATLVSLADARRKQQGGNEDDWTSLAKKNDNKKKANDNKDAAKSKKGEKIIFEAARAQKRDDDRRDGERRGKNQNRNNGGNNNNNNNASINLQDDSLFPKLGK